MLHRISPIKGSLSRDSWSILRGSSRIITTFPSLKKRVPEISPKEHQHGKFLKSEVMHGFVVTRVDTVKEMFLTAVQLVHVATGAPYLHLHRDDGNNVFSIGFRTTPMDSTGLPHILEHTTLCGSQRFPCRDPFFKMLHRSLATFMNAMTGPDYTIYPFSTQNLKDFRNLQSVYLDSVFKPNLRELDFRQEGWRLEHSDVSDKSSPIIFKGVVFNEMKGVFNENQSIFAQRLLNSILPSHTYGVISGGDPLEIPKLTHTDLVNFHSKYYHPSNSRFYSYGNFPLEDHLEFLDKEYLSTAGRINPSMSKVPSEERWKQPRREHISCKNDPMIADPSRQSTIGIANLCNDITNVQITFELYIISQLLLKGPNSAFYKSLVESNLGTGFGPVTGFDAQTRDTMFVVSLQGVRSDDFDKILNVYENTLQKVIVEGFAQDHLEAVLHNIELQVKHQSSNFGLHLLFNLTPLWNHEGSVVQSMRISEAVQNLRWKLRADPNYLQSLTEKYLLKNPHRLTLTMSADETYETNVAAAEEALLKQKLTSLSETELDSVFEQGQILLAEQQKKEDVGVLPTLKIEDLKKDIERFHLDNIDISGVPLQYTIQPTNGICYYRAILNTKNLSEEEKDLLPLFNAVVVKMGTKNFDYRTFDRMVELKTGGLYLSSHLAENKSNINSFEEGIFLHSFCLERNMEGMWDLWKELLNHPNLTDIQRFETLVKITAANLANGIADSGHSYAISSAASLISPIAKLRENQSGLRFVGRMKKLAASKDLDTVLKMLQGISETVFQKDHMRSMINISNRDRKRTVESLQSFYKNLQGESKEPFVLTEQNFEPTETSVHHVLPFTVNYTSKAISTVPYKDPDYAALNVLSKLLTSAYLHPEVREKGGAYSGGAKLSLDGIFSFYSYRDPNFSRTLDIFDGAYDFLQKKTFSERDIDEAKLSLFQRLDAPTPPGNRGLANFAYNLTYDEIQEQRLRAKNVTEQDIMHVAEKYLKPGAEGVKVGRSLIGPDNTDVTNRTSENWIVFDQEEETQAQAVE
ncbi:presequence protease, mitochondrial [Orussus abietinus]|uniref:presequence protease, mitochondrial n=1 Tax=Orussus abietinus TaxID=222816 RepID=UPI000625C745|nr:presequence protease, mitochondrial [Orussus abietinus]